MSKAKALQTEDDGSEGSGALGYTVGAIESRLQRRLKEQEERDSLAQKETSERHALIMQALTIGRKALQETSKINLGKRFSLDLDIQDVDGWPHIQVTLVDSLAPEHISHTLTLSAHDRQKLGTVQLTLLSGEVLGKVHLCDSSEMNRVPLMLKKSVRQFLDLVASYVLNPKTPEELLVLKPVHSMQLEEDEPQDGVNEKLKDQDLFVDEDVRRAVSHKSNVISATDEPLEPVLFSDDLDQPKKGVKKEAVAKAEDFSDDDLNAILQSIKP